MKPLTVNRMAVRLGAASLEQILELRHQLLRQGLPREAAMFPGDGLPTTLHFAATHEGRVVCCLTLILSSWENSPAWQLRGMATAEEMQRTGIGGELMDYAIRTAGKSRPDMTLFWCNARASAAGFYGKRGWKVVSEPFEIETTGTHVKMTYQAEFARRRVRSAKL